MTDLSTSESLFFRKLSIVRVYAHSEPKVGQIVYFGNVRNASDPNHARSATTILVDLDAIEQEGLNILATHGQLSVLLTLAQLVQHIDFAPYLDKAVEEQLRKGNLVMIAEHRDKLRTVIQGKSDLIRSVITKLSTNMRLKDVCNYIKKLGLEDKFANCARVSAYYPDKHYGFIVDIPTGENLFFHDSTVKGVETKSLLQVGRIVQYDTTKKDPQYPRREAIGISIL